MIAFHSVRNIRLKSQGDYRGTFWLELVLEMEELSEITLYATEGDPAVAKLIALGEILKEWPSSPLVEDRAEVPTPIPQE